MYAETPRLVLASDIQIVDAICLFALLSLHTLQCFHSLTNRQTHSLTLLHSLHSLHTLHLPGPISEGSPLESPNLL